MITCPASSATCCRCRSSCSPRPRFLAAAADEPLEQNFVRKHALAYQARAWLRSGDRGAARVRQRRRRLWRERQPSGRERPLGRRGRTRRDLYAAQELCLRPRRASRCSRPRCCRHALADVDLAYQNLDSVELGVTTVDHYFDTLGGISRAVRSAKGGASAPVYIGDQTRGAGRGAHAVGTGRAGDPHPHAQSEMVRGHAQARLRGRAPDRRARHQHAWAGRRPRARSRPGSISSSPRPSCSIPRCASGWRRSIRRPRRRSPTG